MRKNDKTSYLFLSPWIMGLILFTGGPIILSFLLSLTKWNLLGNPIFVGLDNYRNVFAGGGNEFFETIKITLKFTIINVSISVGVSLFLAMMLNLNVKRKKIFQILYFLPAVIPSVVMAGALKLVFNSESGIINSLFRNIELPSINWFGSSKYVWVVLGIASIFTFSTGQMMLIFNSSLKEVPTELYEACSLDGGNFWHKFRHVTIPAISPMILFNIVVATVNSFNGSFTLIYPLTGGGPGNATKVLGLMVYEKAFRAFDMGMASTLAFILFIIVSIISYIQFKLSQKNVSY